MAAQGLRGRPRPCTSSWPCRRLRPLLPPGLMGWGCSAVGHGGGSRARSSVGGPLGSPCPSRRHRSGAELGSSAHRSEFGGGLSTRPRHRRGWGSPQNVIAEGRMGGPWPHCPHGLSLSVCPRCVQLLLVLLVPPTHPGQGVPRRPRHGPASSACRNHHHFIAAGRGQRYGAVSKACGFHQRGGL